MRVLLDHQSETYEALYRQRTTDERINSQAKELGSWGSSALWSATASPSLTSTP